MNLILAVFGAAILVLAAAVAVLWVLANRRVHGKYFDADGVRLHYTDEGQGEPVVLVHGYGANADLNWRIPRVLRRLAEDYRVINLDDRGHGLSDKPYDPKQYGTEMVKDVVRLLDHLGIDKAHVVGYSMGGFITLKLITMFPERLLSAAPCAAGWQPPDEENLALLNDIATALETQHSFAPLIRMLEPGAKDPGKLKAWFIDFVMGHINDIHAMSAVMHAFPEFAVTEAELRANQVPTVSIVGTIDPLRKGVDAMHGVMAHHEVVFVEGGDHLTTIFRRQYIDGLKAFMARNGQARAATVVPAASAAKAMDPVS